MNSTQLEARLHRYEPSCLGADTWAVAKEAAVAAVLATGPTSQRGALDILTALATYLAAPRAWNRTVAPDLGRLLTRAGIISFTSPSGMPGATPGSRRIYRRHLTALAVAAGAITRGPVPPANPPRGAVGVSAGFWPLAKDLGPLRVLADLYCSRGIGFHGATWRQLGGIELDLALLTSSQRTAAGGANARGDDSDMLARVQKSGAALRAVAAVLPVEHPGKEAGAGPRRAPATSVRPNPPTKKQSRTGALRAARAAFVISQADGESNGEACAARALTRDELAPLEPELAGAVANYLPHGVGARSWALVDDAVRLLVTASQPPSLDVLRNRASHLTRFAAWVATRPERATRSGPLEVDEVLVPGLIDAYLAGPLADAPDASRSTARAVLRRAIRMISSEAQPERIGYQPVQPPYTPAQCAGFVRLARNQPTVARRRALSALVGLGLGAGLDGKDQRGVTPDHVVEVALADGVPALAVVVVGIRPRTVVISSAYEDVVREAVALHLQEGRRRDQPLCGQRAARSNGPGTARAHAVTALGDGVNVNAFRLRSTWLLAAMCSPVPLGALLHAAGLRSSRTFADLLPYCPAADPEVTAGLLHDLTNLGAVIPDIHRPGVDR